MLFVISSVAPPDSRFKEPVDVSVWYCPATGSGPHRCRWWWALRRSKLVALVNELDLVMGVVVRVVEGFRPRRLWIREWLQERADRVTIAFMPGGAGYFAAAAQARDELVRLRLIEAECDPHTFRYLDAIGVGAGWRCLEVGAGAGSVVRWLSGRVGPDGQVVAVDIDPRFLGNLGEPNVEVRRCDITGDEVEPACYDLVHSRLLLMHLGDPAGALRRMAAALRPGGWLVAEEPDNAVAEAVDRAHPLAEVFDSCNRKRIEFTSAAGITDLRFGKVLPIYMEALGLVEMGNEGVARVVHGGEPLSRMWIQTWQRIDDVVIANGVLTESEVADMRRAYEDPTFTYRAQLMQSVWGRRRSQQS